MSIILILFLVLSSLLFELLVKKNSKKLKSERKPLATMKVVERDFPRTGCGIPSCLAGTSPDPVKVKDRSLTSQTYTRAIPRKVRDAEGCHKFKLCRTWYPFVLSQPHRNRCKDKRRNRDTVGGVV